MSLINLINYTLGLFLVSICIDLYLLRSEFRLTGRYRVSARSRPVTFKDPPVTVTLELITPLCNISRLPPVIDKARSELKQRISLDPSELSNTIACWPGICIDTESPFAGVRLPCQFAGSAHKILSPPPSQISVAPGRQFSKLSLKISACAAELSISKI